MRGKIAKVFSSSPIQATSQWELARVIVVPKTRADKMMAKTKGFISKSRGLTCIFGVWAQELV